MKKRAKYRYLSSTNLRDQFLRISTERVGMQKDVTSQWQNHGRSLLADDTRCNSSVATVESKVLIIICSTEHNPEYAEISPAHFNASRRLLAQSIGKIECG